MSTAVFSFNLYSFPLSFSCEIVPFTASRKLICPSTAFSQVGAFESSKSAIKRCAPEFKALMTIFLSTGPVISTRRSSKSFGSLAIVQSASRMCFVSSRNFGNSPASILFCFSTRFCKSSMRRSLKFSCSSFKKLSTSGVNISLYAGNISPTSVTREVCVDILASPS
ncbi:Uncharacterised protein [Streptococcus pneumoniae]|nr:Uncharacterised protein [Streptococcus pneumoniae]CJD13875.1 Uncharacterised protein [Streptococcus pneumoniae]